MRNLRQGDQSIEQFTSKHKQATQKWEIYAKGTTWPCNLRPNTNKLLNNEKFTPKGPLDWAIYVQTQTSH